MGTGDTTRYVDDVLELVGVKGKSHERVVRALSVSDIEVCSMAEQIRDRTRQYHKKSWARVSEDLRHEKQPKAFHFYSPKTALLLTTGTDQFLRRAALYFNKIVIEDPLSTLTIEGFTPWGLRNSLLVYMEVLRGIEPWVAEGLVELAPNYLQVESMAGLVDRFEEMDSADPDWEKHVCDLFDPREIAAIIETSTTREALTLLGKGDATRAVPRILSRSSSMKIGYGYFGSNLTGSIPITESREMWKLFQFWISRRMSSDTYRKTIVDSFTRDAKAGRAWLALDARELLVLDRLDPSTIIEIRKSSEHSFQNFRTDLGRAVEEIQGLDVEDEVAYREAVDQAWHKVRNSAESVSKDLPKIEKKLKVSGWITTGLASFTLGLIFALAPGVSPATLGLSLASSAATIAKDLIDYQELKKSSGYFLLNLEEAKQSVGHASNLAQGS
jgi:hypothetical protein